MSRFSRLVLQRCINGGLQRWVDVHRHNDLLRLLALQGSTLLQHLNYLEMQIHGGEMRRMVMFLALTTVLWSQTAAVIEQDLVVTRSFSNKPLPRFGDGFLLAYDFENATVWSSDRTGRVFLNEVKATLPDVTRMQIKDVTASANGMVAVTGTAFHRDGSLVSVIVWINSSGEAVRAVRTTPFAALRITFAKDGTLWAMGRVHDHEFNPVPGHQILRRYDQEGRLIRTLLPEQTFSSPRRHPADGGFLLAAADRIGVYSVAANEWVEVSLEGEILGRWHTPPQPSRDVMITGAALTASGDFYLSMQKDGPIASEVSFPVYRFDKPSGTFQPVTLPSVPGSQNGLLLLGSEGENLILYTKSGRFSSVRMS